MHSARPSSKLRVGFAWIPVTALVMLVIAALLNVAIEMVRQQPTAEINHPPEKQILRTGAGAKFHGDATGFWLWRDYATWMLFDCVDVGYYYGGTVAINGSSWVSSVTAPRLPEGREASCDAKVIWSESGSEFHIQIMQPARPGKNIPDEKIYDGVMKKQLHQGKARTYLVSSKSREEMHSAPLPLPRAADDRRSIAHYVYTRTGLRPGDGVTGETIAGALNPLWLVVDVGGDELCPIAELRSVGTWSHAVHCPKSLAGHQGIISIIEVTPILHNRLLRGGMARHDGNGIVRHVQHDVEVKLRD